MVVDDERFLKIVRTKFFIFLQKNMWPLIRSASLTQFL